MPRHLTHDVQHARIELLDADLGAQRRDLELDDPDHLLARRNIVAGGARRPGSQADAEQADQTGYDWSHRGRASAPRHRELGRRADGSAQLTGKGRGVASENDSRVRKHAVSRA